MKKLIFMMFSILLFTAINATTITKVKQEPSYVSPGETFELFLKVENKGSSTSGNVRIGFEENENFKANGNLESFKSLGKIGSNQEPSIISFKIDVGENVLVGTNKLEISVYEGLSSTQSFSTNIDIEVRDENQQLRVQKITTPEIRAGEEGKIQIELYNENSNFLKDIILELKLNEIEDKKISTIGETNEKIVKKISGNEKVVVDFNIIADPSITTKPYQIPIKLTYSDSLGTKIEKEILTTLKIKSEPKIRILKEKEEDMKDGTKKVSVTLVNSGTSQAKEVFITAKESELVKVVGGKSQYIGYLNSDDLQIVTFKVITKGQTYMDLIVDYANTYNENQKEIVSSIELGKSKKSSPFFSIFLLLIIGAGGFFGYRYFKKKKKTSKK